MNCLIRIRQRYPDLAQSDGKLADCLLAQPDTARHHNFAATGGRSGRQPIRKRSPSSRKRNWGLRVLRR
ncbi:hypothetical protein KCP73_19840 [Salmonella enterica subsp. enterica]|nr:hypothetical protein KCP73_19840 [Salmonella enterica subsp. enterica]